MTLADTARELRRLHADPELLQVVNVWDVATARAVAALPGTRAIATASHSIAAAFGYPDGEQIPVDLMVLAAAVLTTTGRGYIRPALIQGTLPLIGFVLFVFA